MGCYDSVSFNDLNGEEREIQFKSGECCLRNYKVGDSITDVWDGIHFDYEDCFVIFKGIIVAAFNKADGVLYTKWGGKIDFPDINPDNPITQAVKNIPFIFLNLPDL